MLQNWHRERHEDGESKSAMDFGDRCETKTQMKMIFNLIFKQKEIYIVQRVFEIQDKHR